MQVLEKSPLHFVLVVSAEGVLLGTVTDGDIRRGLMQGRNTLASVQEVMNRQPLVIPRAHSRETALALMHRHSIRHLPVVDATGCVIAVESLDDLSEGTHDHEAIIMAGGLGMRLRPLTEKCPKPLLPVGGRPVVDIVIEGLIASGFRRITLCVNYLAEMVTNAVGNGDRWGIDIRYVHETKPLGTAGALSLLQPPPAKPFLVLNADVLTRVDFRRLLAFHHQAGSRATMCVRNYEMQIPYGVIRADEHRLMAIEEKPMQMNLVNAGIYLLDPSILSLLDGHRLDMTTLFSRLIAQEQPAHVFPVFEYWLDVGRHQDLDRANVDFSNGRLH